MFLAHALCHLPWDLGISPIVAPFARHALAVL